LPYLALPSVTHFTGYLMGGGVLDTENRVLPATDFYPRVLYRYPKEKDPKFRISDLRIVHSALGNHSFRNLLGCFEAVRRLEYNFDYNMIWPNYEYREVHVDFASSELRDAMAHLADSLEELSITQENYRDPQHPTLDPGMMALADFTNLKKLEAPEIVLVGTGSVVRHLDTPYTEEQIQNFLSVFPSSFEYLAIKHCDNAIVDPVLALFDGKLPSALKNVRPESSGDAAAKPQFEKGQFLLGRALERGLGLTFHVSPITRLQCGFCEEYETRIQEL
jgi:hypothetical protein